MSIHVPQNHLLGLLLKKSQPLRDYTLLLNTRVVTLVEENNHYAGVKAISDGKEITIKSSLIVGADGRFSTVRKLAKFPVSKIHHGYDLLWARIPAPKDWEPTIRMALVDDKQVALFTQQGGYVQIGWNIPEGSFSKIRKGSFQPFIHKLIEAFPELEETVTKNITSWNDFTLLQVQSSKSDTWVMDRVVIIGDAAHTMSPTGAYGLNSSMKDAEVLFQIIDQYGPIQHLSSHELKQFEKIRSHDQHDVRFEARRDAAIEEQLLDRPVTLHAGVDDAIADAARAPRYSGNPGGGHRTSARAAPAPRAPASRRARRCAARPAAGRDVEVAHALRVDGDGRRELVGGEDDEARRPQPVADGVVGHEELLEGRGRFAAALPAEERLERGEFATQHERGHEQSADREPPGTSPASPGG